MIIVMVLTLVMQVIGQTKPILTGSEALAQILEDAARGKSTIPFELYPYGLLEWLDKMGDEPLYEMFRGSSMEPLALTVEDQASMAWIPPGNFVMGNYMDLDEGVQNELPLHSVYVSGFYIGKYEVTKELWDDVYDWAITHSYSFDNSASGKDTDHPVQMVNWYDCVKWCNARSEKEGMIPAYYTSSAKTTVYRTGQVDVDNSSVNWSSGYRLPTEAEWEKAARGGTSGHRFPWSNTDNITHTMANYYSSSSYAYDTSSTRGYHSTFTNSQPYTSPVGYFAPNDYGLYDMAGNALEWCWDWYGSYSSDSQIDPLGPTSGSTRIARGGFWAGFAIYSRVAFREFLYPVIPIDPTGFRPVLPSTFEWRQAIETQPVQPTYGNCPAKGTNKNSLVLVTHGWINRTFSPISPDDPAWVDGISNVISGYLTSHSLTNWQIYGYKWVDGAWKVFPTHALNNAKQAGEILGDCLGSQGWSHIHLIAHSAGAGLIQAATERIKTLTNTTVHCTFLDPYVGRHYEGVSRYGTNADWSDQYFSRDSLTRNRGLGSLGPLTESPLDNAYNVDVTPLDPNKEIGMKFRSSVTGEMEPCIKTMTSHEWPYEFYSNTITGNITSEYEGFGFPLSKEGGGWSSGVPNYTPGNDPAQILGTPDPSCIEIHDYTPPAWANTVIDFTESPTIQSDTGTIQKWLDSLKLSSGSPAWIATVVSSTNPINMISFDTQFSSTNGAQGLLSVYWDDQVIGSIDERVFTTNHYTFSFPNTTANSGHILGFRLDSFTNIQSIVTITNIVLNQVGVSQPFSLSLTGGSTNGSLIYQLAGEAGFEYHVQASTNLVDWSDIAVLQNTNGTVRFYDPNSTSYPMRFYRGVAPY